MAVELVERHLVVAAWSISRRDHEEQVLDQQRVDIQPLDGLRIVGEPEVDVPLVQPFHHVFAEPLHEGQGDAGKGRAALLDDSCRHEGAGSRGDAERQAAARRPGEVDDLLAGALDLAQDRLGVSEQGEPGLGRRDAARMAHQQRRAELALQLPDLEPQRGLGDADPFGGLGEALRLDHLHEVSQLAHVHRAALRLRPAGREYTAPSARHTIFRCPRQSRNARGSAPPARRL